MSTATTLTFSMDEENEGERPQLSGLSRDDHITQFLNLDSRRRELSYQIREHTSALTEIAQSERNGQKTVHLQANDGSRIQVEFKTDWDVNQEEVEVAKELLKDEEFNKLFKTVYTPRVRELKKFLNTVFPDEAWNTAKEIIKEHVKEVDGYPYVSVEKKRS